MWGGAFKFVHRWYGVYVSPTLSLCVFDVAMVFVCVNKCHVTWELTKGKSICCQFGFYGSQRIYSTLSDLYLFVCFTLLVVFSPFSFRYVHSFFPRFHAESKFCMFASLYVSMVVWLSVNIFFLAHFFYYIAFLYGSHELEREWLRWKKWRRSDLRFIFHIDFWA